MRSLKFMEINVEEIHASIGPVQEILDQHDGIVNVIDTTDGNIMISLEGGCTGCSSTPMTAMQIYYSLMKLENVNDVIFVYQQPRGTIKIEFYSSVVCGIPLDGNVGSLWVIESKR